ncbi:MAG TPA: hypothetical protein VFE78_36805 [Gemmataceae bacterium]|jgi:hypothetical protein|nr:hypothetical protein [Gemmataceae bacterium]
MTMQRGARWAVLAALLLPAAAGAATPLLGFRTWDDPHNCPPSTYSPWHYITPAFFRANAFCHPTNRYTYAVDRYPGVPLQFNPIPYKCVSVPPEPFSMDHYYPGARLPVPPLEGCSSWPPGSCPPRPVQSPGNGKAPAVSAQPDSARPEAIPAPKPGS